MFELERALLDSAESCSSVSPLKHLEATVFVIWSYINQIALN